MNLPMIKFAFLFAVVAAATAGPLTHHSNRRSISGRITGGTDYNIEDIPWQVSLIFEGNHVCGGSIISEYWVVTAGHCLWYGPSSTEIRAGSTTWNSGGSVHRIAAHISHEDFHLDEYLIPLNDIALIQVDVPFTLDSTRAVIPLYSDGEIAVVGSEALISGWGSLLPSEIVIPDNLQAITVPVISQAECNATYLSRFNGIREKQICAVLPEGGKGPCSGDSGGPLAIGGRLAGLVTWGDECGRAGNPGVYTEIASYRAWITKNSGV